MILYLKKVQELLKKFTQVQVKHVPRAENSRADALVKLATASQEDLGRLIPIEHLPEPSVSIDNGEVSPVMSEPRWMDPMGLLGGWYIAKRPKGGIQTQSEVGKIHCSSGDPL